MAILGMLSNLKGIIKSVRYIFCERRSDYGRRLGLIALVGVTGKMDSCLHRNDIMGSRDDVKDKFLYVRVFCLLALRW